ncbi:cyclic pyranopterin monophosphate synthase subunit MoaA [Muriicola jejuensis]|uniref:GTP 3',8-cyclase n=1 Tax=Muriicola jejuensis TaxID=504488 RepID=A0A6P0UHI5_9FLAO|nr:GTP 3',8-cyclase MoaA [Muriicola jejuensis]NER11278.1 GTP 3',8-cyclase MoaA [Muriicola jejuensis]SMP21787.1 cyclic pyranopterin monophosphate synthase subunit MoaA [Muriicola jejuensis]
MLIDNHGRKINYLRLAVTDRCNLRCHYCMPAEGIHFAKKDNLLSMEELKLLAGTLVDLGIDKIRLTGGEPFVRKDLMVLLRYLSSLTDIRELSMTTNATLIGPYIEELKSMGITNINLSLDAIRKETFEKITRRDQFDVVYGNLMTLIDKGFNLRINFIVLENQNEQDIIPILKLQEEYPVSVRFLEEMPFNGGSRNFQTIKWNYREILKYIGTFYPDYEPLESPETSTSLNYKIPGHAGSFGIIPSFSRTFCGSCNRLRITATGDVITCLYGKPKMNVREILRGNDPVSGLKKSIVEVIGKRAKTGFEAQEEHKGVFENSMTSIGG